IILHVEDNQEDITLLTQACGVAGLPADFHGVSSGNDAVAYLNGDGAFADRARHPLPDVIVLDLRMPGMDGFEFLRWLRTESGFRGLPALVFTQMATVADRTRALAEGATGYFLKPVDRESLERLTESLRRLKAGLINGMG